MTTQPQLIAQHCVEAGLTEKAAGYWLRAGQQSVAHSAMTEAVSQLQKALGLLAILPDGSARWQLELDLRIALGRALMATRGNAAPDVGETVARARALAEQLDRPDYLVPLLYGQWVFHATRAEHRLSLSFAEQVEKIAEAENDVALLWMGQYLRARTYFYLGEFLAARSLYEQCQERSDPAHRAVYSELTTEDAHAVMLASLAMTLTYLGYVNQGRARMNEALLEARRLEHAYTLTYVMTFACRAEWAAGSRNETQQQAEEMVALSNQHGFLQFLGWGLLHRGSSLTARGQEQEGLTLLTKGLSVLRSTGGVASTPYALVMIAEAYAKLGQPVEALNCLAEAGQIIETTDDRYSEANVHWLRGNLRSATGELVAAEQSYHQALAIAKRQSARLFELRAATSLARLWRDQGKRIEARDLLAPIYGWFTEGFDAPVLQEAKALLDQLTRYLPC